MKDIDLKSRVMKLTKSKQLWKTGETITTNPYAKPARSRSKKPAKPAVMRFRTYAYALPLDAVSVEAVSVNGTLVWASNGRQGVRSAILGGGGRFVHTRSLYDRCVVAQTILLKDIPYHTEAEPEIKLVISEVDHEALAEFLRKQAERKGDG